MTDGQQWANTILASANDRDCQLVIDAINAVAKSGPVNSACAIVACSQILAQSIAGAPPDIAPEVRSGILALIDGYAMRVATERDVP